MQKLVLFFGLFVAITSTCTTPHADNITSKYCIGLALDDNEKKVGDSCCFVTHKKDNKESKTCNVYNKSAVPEYVKNNTKDFPKLSIVCSSNWISYSLFLVALIFMI